MRGSEGSTVCLEALGERSPSVAPMSLCRSLSPSLFITLTLSFPSVCDLGLAQGRGKPTRAGREE